MAYSDENLENFTQKIQELLWKKEENYLSENDLKQIAQSIGMSEEDIEQAKKDYFARGKGHSQHKNWQDAIPEFEQLLLLSPNNAEAYYGLAEANYELWVEENKKAYKKKALNYAKQAIQSDSKHNKAYALIKNLKGKRLTFKPKSRNNVHKTRVSLKAQSRKYKTSLGQIFTTSLAIFGMIAGFVAIFYYEVYPLFNSSESELSSPDNFQVAIGKKGSVAWLHKNDDLNDECKIYIINPINREILKEIELEENISNLIFIGNNFYYNLNDSGGFEGRDMYTGEIVDSKDILSRHYKELQQGVGEISWYDDSWILLTLKKDGSEYWYSPYLKKVMTKDQRHYDQSLLDINLWYNVKIEKLSKFYLVKTKVRKSEFYGKETITNKTQKKIRLKPREEQLSFESPEFLEATMVYGDKNFCIINHQTEIGNDAEHILSAMNTKGEIVWEFKEGDKDTPVVIQKIFNDGAYNINTQRYENTLLIDTKQVTYKDKYIAIALALDINTGKILWQYSPDTKL